MRVRRLEVLDEYVEDGRAAVYTSKGMVVLLSELATAAWNTLDDAWKPTVEVAEALIRQFGDPGDGAADQLTENALRSLAELSLVELSD